MDIPTNGKNGGPNWAILLNVAMLAVIILGAWFTTFSGPLNEKFVSMSEANKSAIEALSRELNVQIRAQEASTHLAAEAARRLTKETETATNARFAAHDKISDEIKAVMRDMAGETERRRVEVATKADLTALLNVTRLEFLSEIKRIDVLVAQGLTKEAFDIWRVQSNIMDSNTEKRIDALSARFNVTLDRQLDKLVERPPK